MDAENALGKINPQLMIKKLPETRNRRKHSRSNYKLLFKLVTLNLFPFRFGIKVKNVYS